jgi:hypothetical protein
LESVQTTEGDGRWFLIEAIDGDEALNWSPDFEVTGYPTKMIWSDTTREGVIAARDEYLAHGNRAQVLEWRNRPFLVRAGTSGIEPPRSPAQFRQLPSAHHDLPGMQWFIVRADHPADIDMCIQAHGSLKPGPGSPIAIEAECGTWQEASHRLKALGL